MTQFTAQELPPERFEQWDRFVEDHPQGTLFHTTRWLARHRSPVNVVTVVDGAGCIRAGMAWIVGRKLGVKGIHIPPYTPYFGPLVAEPRRASRASARTEAQRVLELLLGALPRSGHVDMKLSPGSWEIFPYLRAGFSSSVVFSHELRDSVLDYQRNIAKTRRNYLARLDRLVDAGQLVVDIHALHREVVDLWRRAAEVKGVSHRTDALIKLLEPPSGCWHCRAVVVRSADGTPLAGSVLVVDGRRAYHLVNGVSQSLSVEHRQVNLLCLDAAIRWTLAEGKVFDFEGSMLPGVEEAYRLLGGVPVPLVRLQRSRSLLYFIMRIGRQLLTEQRGARHRVGAAR